MLELPNLRFFFLLACKSLTSLEGMPELPGLTMLTLSGCESLRSLEGMPELSNLHSLNLENCKCLEWSKAISALQRLSGECTVLLPNLRKMEVKEICERAAAGEMLF